MQNSLVGFREQGGRTGGGGERETWSRSQVACRFMGQTSVIATVSGSGKKRRLCIEDALGVSQALRKADWNCKSKLAPKRVCSSPGE